VGVLQKVGARGLHQSIGIFRPAIGSKMMGAGFVALGLCGQCSFQRGTRGWRKVWRPGKRLGNLPMLAFVFSTLVICRFVFHARCKTAHEGGQTQKEKDSILEGVPDVFRHHS